MRKIRAGKSKKRNPKRLLINITILLVTLLIVTAIYFAIRPWIINLTYGDIENAMYIKAENITYFYLKDVDSLNKDDFMIINFGDSVTEADCPITAVLQDKLNKRFPEFTYEGTEYENINVLNAGLGGADSKKIIQIMRATLKRLPEKPKIMTLLTGWNDHWYSNNICADFGCYQEDGLDNMDYWIMNPSIQGCKDCRNILMKLREKIYDNPREECGAIVKAVGYKTILAGLDINSTRQFRLPIFMYEDFLGKMVDIAQGYGIKVVMVVPPNALTPGVVPEMSLMDCTLIDPANYYDIHMRYTQVIRDFAQRRGLDIIDLEKEFNEDPRKSKLFTDPSFDPIHPNSEGKYVCTDNFYDILVRYIEKGATGQ